MNIQGQSSENNTSGMGNAAVIPPGVRGWSWGAFLLSWIWGIGNSVYIALLALIPGVNIVMMIVLGINGREWAWRNRRWLSVEDFRTTQRNWAIAGAIVWMLAIGIPVAAMQFFHIAFQEPKEVALNTLRQNPEAVEMLGEPVQTGWFTSGRISSTLGSTCAAISIPVSGPKASGYVTMFAVSQGASWLVLREHLDIDGQRIMIANHPDRDDYAEDVARCLK